MKITRIEAADHDIGFQNQRLQTSRVAAPMSRWREYRESRSSWSWPSRRTLVRIQTDTGLEGWGSTNGGEVTSLIVNAHFGSLLPGLPVDDIEGLWDRMFSSILPVDRSGFAMMAISAVDIALWDLACQIAGRSLVDLLGGTRHETVPCYATTVSPKAQTDRNWWGLKGAATHGPWEGPVHLEENVELMRRFRNAAGPNRPIMIDAFMAWDAEYTLAFAERCEELALYWIEDPAPPQDIRALAEIKAGLDGKTRLALGNFAFHRWDCEQLLHEGIVDVLQPDVSWAGGITECRRIMSMAERAGVPVVLHNTCEQPWALALAATSQRVPIVEFVDRGEDSALYGVLSDPTEFVDGQAIVPTTHVRNMPTEDLVGACLARWQTPGSSIAQAPVWAR